MAFYYFFNPAINSFAGIDHMQSYLSSFSPICQNSSEAMNSTYYTWNFPQN